MSIEPWLAFVVASAALLVIPGPTILTVISYSMARGLRATFPLAAAVALGDSTALAFSLVGLGALLSISVFWFTVVKTIGGLYLLCLGFKLLRAEILSTESPAPAATDSRRRLFASTYLVTTLNPQGVVFFVAFLPQFIDPGANVREQVWVLAATFVVMATLNTALYAVFAVSMRKLFTSRKAQRRFNRAGGSLLLTAGVWALLVRRHA